MKKTLILIGFILLKFFLQYTLISPEYDLHRDEYLHLDQAHHLAWGYYSIPPFTSWVSYLIYWLGNSIFWVKFFPALFGVLTLIIVWKTIEELNGNLFALILGATGVLFSTLLVLNNLYQPNSLDVLGWTSLYFILIKYINTQNSRWLFMGAIVFALAFLNKYNIAFLVIGAVPAILLSTHRNLLINRDLYLAVILGLLLILPNLYWQYTQDFPVIRHLSDLARIQLVNVDRWDFLKSQILFFIGSFLVLLGALYALLFYRPFQKYQLFFWAMIFTLAVYTYLRAKDYYAIGIYPIYLAFGSVFWAEILKEGWKKYLRPILLILPLLSFIPIYYVFFLNRNPEYIIKNHQLYEKLDLLRWEDGQDHTLPQDFADILGWRELAQKVDKAYTSLPNADKTLILCDNYGQAGAINYYTKQKIRAVSFNADYIDWFDLDKNYENLIRVKEAEDRHEEMATTSPYFEKSLVQDSITNPYAREYLTTIFVFSKAKIDIKERIKAEIKTQKNRR